MREIVFYLWLSTKAFEDESLESYACLHFFLIDITLISFSERVTNTSILNMERV